MDFAWVVDALRRGLKVTRKSWPGQKPQYIRITREPGQETIAFVGSDGQTRRWMCSSIDVLATDWEEYVEPKKAAPAKSTQEDLPVWPEVNADGYARMNKDSDVVIHDGVYRFKKEPAKDNADRQLHIGDKKPTFKDLCDDYLSQQKGTCYIGKSVMPGGKELHGGEKSIPASRQEGPFVISSLPLTTTMEMRGGQAVEQPDLDAEANKAIALVARNIADNLVELLRNPSVQHILQKTDVQLSKEDTNHV